MKERNTLSSLERRSLPPLYTEERHSLFCTEKESPSSLEKRDR